MDIIKKFYRSIFLLQVFFVLVVVLSVNGLIGIVNAQTTGTNYDYFNSTTSAFLALGASLAIGMSAIGAGLVLKTVGTAAISAITERPESFGKLIVIVALGEAIAIYGLIVALLLLFKIPSPV